MKKPKPQPGQEQEETSRQGQTPEEDMSQEQTGAGEVPASEASTGSTPAGLKWLKYAGIGPARQRQGKQDKAGTGPDRERKRIVGKNLSGEGITSLGSLEAELMGLLWELGQPATGMEVMEQSLYKRRAQGQEPVSFATVATTLRRLSEKGIVESKKNAQGTPVYVPIVAREEMAARILNNVSVTLLGQSLHRLLPRLLGTLRTPGRDKAVDAGEQEEVARLMRALEKAARGEDGAAGEAAQAEETGAEGIAVEAHKPSGQAGD